MGVVYLVDTLEEFAKEPAEYLEAFYEPVDIPAVIPPCRYPSMAEIESTLAALQITVEKLPNGDWLHLDLEGPNGETTELSVQNPSPDTGNRFSFNKGSVELILRVTHELAKLCGPFVIIPDTGGDPLILYPSTVLSETGWFDDELDEEEDDDWDDDE